MFDVVNLGSDLSIGAGDAFSVSGMADFAGQLSTDANMIADLSLAGCLPMDSSLDFTDIMWSPTIAITSTIICLVFGSPLLLSLLSCSL